MSTPQFRIYLLIEDDTDAIQDLMRITKTPEGWAHLVHEYKHSITTPFELNEHFPVQNTPLDTPFMHAEQAPFFVMVHTTDDEQVNIEHAQTSAIFGEYV